ncbi:MAG: hypothetical protein DMF06_15885, partial [Verrucomicrobia bacterium]
MSQRFFDFARNDKTDFRTRPDLRHNDRDQIEPLNKAVRSPSPSARLGMTSGESLPAGARNYRMTAVSPKCF